MPIRSIITVFAALALTSAAPAEGPTALPNRFYAMDTAGGSLDMLKELGYAGQSGTFSGRVDDVTRQAEELERRGLELFAVYVDASLARDGLHTHDGMPELFRALKDRPTVVWLHIGTRDFPDRSPEGDAVAVPGLRRLADEAAKSNVRLAIYPHRGEWTERFSDALRVANAVDRDNFGVSFNLCHALAAGEEDQIDRLLREAKPRLVAVTINGADGGTKTDQERSWSRLIQPLGSGSFDPLPLIRTLRQIGYEGPIGFQGYGVAGERRDVLTKTIAAWRQLATTAAAP